MKPLRTFEIAVYSCFALILLLEVVSMWQDHTLIEFLEAIRRGGPVDIERANEIDANSELVGYLMIAAALALAVAFCAWFHRAHSNLRAARLPHLKYGSGWTIGGFFVPFLNLVRPYQVMREVWMGTEFLAGTARVRSWQSVRVSPLVGTWWGLLFASGAAARMSVSLQTRFDFDSKQMIEGAWVSIASSILSIAAAVAAVLIVRRITELQAKAVAQADEPA